MNLQVNVETDSEEMLKFQEYSFTAKTRRREEFSKKGEMEFRAKSLEYVLNINYSFASLRLRG
jgi:hypothetical protein